MEDFIYNTARVVRDAQPGDVLTIAGKRVRLVKKTNYAIMVEPYTWLDAVEDWVLEKLGKRLP